MLVGAEGFYMSWKEGICLLSGSRARVDYDMMKQVHYVDSDACGYYWLGESVGYQIERIRKENGFEYSQGQINCARKTLEVRRDRGEKIIPVWSIRENVERLQKIYDENKKPGERELVVLSFDDIANEFVDHSQKAIDLLTVIAQKIGRSKAFSKFKISHSDRAWARIVDSEELLSILQFLEQEQLIVSEVPLRSGHPGVLITRIYDSQLQITVLGWDRIKEKSNISNTNEVFIATAFNWPENLPCKQEEAIAAIKRACSRLGYKAETVTQNHTNNITDRIIAEIRRSNFMICELTHNNRGAYYESGFARGLGRNVFHLVHKDYISGSDSEGKKIHFDVQQVMYRSWETPKDLEQKLVDWIEATVGKYK